MSRHVAVVLTTQPDSGGRFQYALSVLAAVCRLRTSGTRISVVCLDQAWRDRVTAADVEVHVCSRTLLGRVVRKTAMAVPGGGRLWRATAGRVHPLVRLVERLAPDLAVYAGNDPYCYESDVPALVPVFDLMHRYEPSFKGSAGGAVERRETHFRRLCASARGLLVDSTVGRAHVLECYGVDPAKVFILPYVAPSYIGRLKGSGDAVRKFGLPADYVFYPAQLRKHKNHVGLLRALAVLRHRGLVVHAVFAGSSLSGAAELFETVTALGLRDQVQYLSYVNDAEIVGLYEHAKALVMPTFFGPTNIPPLEAFILGCPVVTSGIYGIPEQLGDAALFCDPRNPEDIADKVARVWLDTDLRRVLIERGYRHAARWNQSHFDERFGAIVEACLAGQGPSLDVSALGKSGGIPVPMRD